MRKIGIIGTAPASRAVTPFQDQSWDLWACSPGNMAVLQRVSVWYELHSIVEMKAAENAAWWDNYWKWLRAQTFPIWMQEPNEFVPQAMTFPYKDIVRWAGTRNWFTSTPAWMMAHAIYQHQSSQTVAEIGIFGVDMAAPQEYYTMQKGGLIYWIERAQAAGIKVTIPHESCLGMPTPLYGYSESSRFGRRMNVMQKITSDNLALLQQQQQNTANQIAYHQGALESQQYFMRTALDGLDDAELDVPEKAKAHADKATSWSGVSGSGGGSGGTKFGMNPETGLLVPLNGNGGAGEHIEPEAQ
jgi:hypothetical protein